MSSFLAHAKGEKGEFVNIDGIQMEYSLIPLDIESDLIHIINDGRELKAACLVKVTDGFSNFERYGIQPNSVIGNIFTAHVTADQLDSLLYDPDVDKISASYKCELLLDTSGIAMGAAMATDSFGLTGKGVIVGIVDSDIDVYNDDFSETSDSSKTRILYLFKANDPTGPSPYNYGTEYTKVQIDSFLPPKTVLEEHGTRVLGIAAGNGFRTKGGIFYGTFKGLAPEASIIAVDIYGGIGYTDLVVDGVYYIADKANDLNMPCVINLSVASHQGPRDGTSLFKQAIDFIGSEIGKIVVVGAGNDNFDSTVFEVDLFRRCHARNTSLGYPSSGDTVELMVRSDGYTFTNDILRLEIWYPLDSSDFYFTILDPSGHYFPSYGPGTGPSPPGTAVHTGHGLIGFHNECYDQNTPDPYPDSYGHVSIILADDVTYFDPLEDSIWKIIADSGCGTWDTYLYDSKRDADDNKLNYIVDFQNEGCITEPGNGNCVITVGSFNTKNSWINILGSTPSNVNPLDLPLGDTSYFSSRGPTRDGRNKPDILAPGAYIASSISDSMVAHYCMSIPWSSEWIAYDSCHYHAKGTSYAAPHITGLVALMLQVDPDIDYLDVLDCIQSTSIDGKVDAYGALECIGATIYYGMCGDANKDGVVNISDAIYLINYVYLGGSLPKPTLSCGDANSDTAVNVSDAVWIINYVFVGGGPPSDCSPGSWYGQGGDCPPFN